MLKFGRDAGTYRIMLGGRIVCIAVHGRETIRCGCEFGCRILVLGIMSSAW